MNVDYPDSIRLNTIPFIPPYTVAPDNLKLELKQPTGGYHDEVIFSATLAFSIFHGLVTGAPLPAKVGRQVVQGIDSLLDDLGKGWRDLLPQPEDHLSKIHL